MTARSPEAAHRPERVTFKNGIIVEGAGWPMLVARGCSGNIWLDGRTFVCVDCGQSVSARLVAHDEEAERRYCERRGYEW